ncbi:MAG: hypothetical protein ABL925_20040 [Methylococcales bacterium]
MKITKIIKYAALVSTVLFNTAVLAYTADRPEEECRKPHFRDFSLPVYVAPENKEVPPEVEFSIMMSPWTHPGTVVLTAKNEKLAFNMESNDSFHRLTAKLPASYNGKFVRLNISAKSVLGCDHQEGWLIKVADVKANSQPAPASVEPPAAEAQPTQPAVAEQPQTAPAPVTPSAEAAPTPAQQPQPAVVPEPQPSAQPAPQ